MKIHILTTHLPPELDGTADHTWGVALGLRERAELTLYHPVDNDHWPLEGVRFVPSFERYNPATLTAIPAMVARDAPDWFVAQFYPLSYGGSNFGELHFVRMLRDIRRHSPCTRVGLILHERVPQVLRTSNPLRRLWIRKRMEWAIEQTDLVFLLVEPWALEFSRKMPTKRFCSIHLGSMFPPPTLTREAMRARLGIARETLVLGLFGRAEPTRTLDLLKPALDRLRGNGRDFLVLHIGNDEGRTLKRLAGYPVRSAGPASHQEVTCHAVAMDIYLGPYEDGCSTRRTSMMMALELGLPLVGTKGSATCEALLKADGHALLLAPTQDTAAFADHILKLAGDAGLRSTIGAQGRLLYQREFTYDAAGQKMLFHLGRVNGRTIHSPNGPAGRGR